MCDVFRCRMCEVGCFKYYFLSSLASPSSNFLHLCVNTGKCMMFDVAGMMLLDV